MKIFLRVIINTAVVCLCIHGYYNGDFGALPALAMVFGEFAGIFFPSLLTALALLGVSRVCNHGQFLPPRAGALAALVGVLLFFPCLETFLKVEDTGFLSGISAGLEMISAALAFDVILLYILIRWNSRYVGRARGEEGQEEGNGKESFIMSKQEIFRTGFNIVSIAGVIQLYYYTIQWWIEPPVHDSVEYWFWGVLLPCSLALIVPLLLHFALCFIKSLRVSTENAVKLALWALLFLSFSAILFIGFLGFYSDPGWVRAEFVDNHFSVMSLEITVAFFALSILAVCWLSVVSYLDWKSGDQQ